MLPSRYRGRYTLFILLSLLVHFTAVVAVFWVSDEEQEQKKDKTVTVTLKKEEPKKEEPKKEEPKKEEPKKEEPKKEEPKKEEPKKEEPKKEEPKKEDPKKEEPKKEEPKKEEPKKEEPKKEEPKKEEPKKEKPKKEEPKKEEPKKEEPKKEEPKKQEPKKQEPKKQEPKKQEPKKQEPKKQEPKKQEPKKQEPKKQEPKKQEPKQSEPSKAKLTDPKDIPMIRDSMSHYGLDDEAPKEKQAPMKRFGSMQVLDERSMAELVVSTQSLDRKFTSRNIEGEQIKQELNFFQMQEFNSSMQLAMNKIESYITAVPWDGKQYYGEINFYVDKDGAIEKIVIKRSSGHEALDQSMIQALIQTKKVPMPYDQKARKAMYLTKKLLYYTDKDMTR